MALDPRWPEQRGYNFPAPPGIAPPEAQRDVAAQMQLAAAAMEMQVMEVQARAHAHLAQAAHLMMSLPQDLRLPDAAADGAPWPGQLPAVSAVPALRQPVAGLGGLPRAPRPPPTGLRAPAPAERHEASAPPPTGGRQRPEPPPAEGQPRRQRPEPPPAEGQPRSRPGHGTLRTHLEETRALDPRCVFVVRRINRLGFRSKAVLEKHYSRFGEVAKIMVSHQQAKGWANQTSVPRTRPGNFGLVVMKSPAATSRILELGPEQMVGDVAIQVHEYHEAKSLEGGAGLGLEAVPEVLERAPADAGPRAPPRPGPPPGLAADGAAEPPAGGGGPLLEADEAEEVAAGPAGPMPRQESESAEVAAANPCMPRQESEESGVSGSSGCTRNSNDTGLERDSGNWGSGASCNADEECSEQTSTSTRASLAGLTRCLSTLGTLNSAGSSGNSFGSPGDRGSPSGSTPSSASRSSGDLVVMLNELGRIAKDPQRLNGFTQEQSASAASLAQWAQRSLANLEQECCCKIEQLLLSGKDAAPSPPGLELDVAGQQGRPSAQQGGHAAPTAADARSAAGSATGARKRGAHAELGGAQGKACSRSPLQNPGTSGPQNDTLRFHLTELLSEDPNSIFITRRINKLGFCSREILKQHYSKYGKVLRVLVANSKVKPFRDSMGQMRTRPGGLGLIVMQNADQVRAVLAAGAEQDVSGHQIHVQRFERPTADDGLGGKPWGAERGTSGDSGRSTTAGSAAGSGSGSGSRTRRSQGSGSHGSASNGSGQGGGRHGTPKETSGSDEGIEAYERSRQASGESEGCGSSGLC